MFHPHYIRKIHDLPFTKWFIDDLTAPELKKWWSHVTVKKSGCWIWNIKRTRCKRGLLDAYGSFSLRGRQYLAHRVSFVIFHHPLPCTSETRKIVINHTCHNKRCVNPQHLEMVSQRVNTQRGMDYYAQNKRLYTRRYFNYDVSVPKQ